MQFSKRLKYDTAKIITKKADEQSSGVCMRVLTYYCRWRPRKETQNCCVGLATTTAERYFGTHLSFYIGCDVLLCPAQPFS